MFCCLPPNSKCEWSNLEKFVKQYNDNFGKQYKRSKCLDVSERNTPQPEVLLENVDGSSMVIERKVVV